MHSIKENILRSAQKAPCLAYFSASGDGNSSNSRALHEYARINGCLYFEIGLSNYIDATKFVDNPTVGQLIVYYKHHTKTIMCSTNIVSRHHVIFNEIDAFLKECKAGFTSDKSNNTYAPRSDRPQQQTVADIDMARIFQEIERHIEHHIKKYIPKIVDIRVNGISYSAPGLRHFQYETVLKAASVGNVLMVGPAGSGKTEIARFIAKDMGRPFYFNGPIQSEYKLLGFRDANGEYHRTAFYTAYTSGGVYLFDEIDASSPQALVAFNTALANKQCDFPNSAAPISAHKDFICIAAANTYGRGISRDYVGRNQLDAATLDRFITVHIDYDLKIERELANNDRWVAKIQQWRKRAEELKTRHIISMRAAIVGAKLLEVGVEENEVEEMVVWRGLDQSTVQKIKAR